MKGREFYNQAIEKAIRWNHGMLPEARIQLTFICNELRGKVVLDDAELQQIAKIVDSTWLDEKDIKDKVEKLRKFFHKILCEETSEDEN